MSLVLNSEWNGIHVAQATARGSQVLGLSGLHGKPHLESRKKGGKEGKNGRRKAGKKEKKETRDVLMSLVAYTQEEM